MTTAVQPPTMTRQSLPLDSYLPPAAGADFDTHRLSSSVISPLSLPGPVRPFQFSQTHLLASTQSLNRHTRSDISSKYRSVSASPTSSRKPAPANGRPALVGPPSASTAASSSSATDSDRRARISMMEVERAAWEAEKAGFQRHIEVLEAKLHAVMLEKEELQDTVTRLEHLIGEHQDIGHLQANSSGLIHDRTPRFVPYAIPGPTTVTAMEISHIETQIGASKNPSGTNHMDAQCSAQQPSESPKVETVDVSDINPSLEGIRLKSATIQRSTFSDTKSPPLLSSESSSLSIPTTQIAMSPPEQNLAVSRNSKAQTLHVLATDVAGRRRMHAGHTPSHSVAHFPIPVATEVAEAALGAAQGVAAELAADTRKCSDASESEAPAIGEPRPRVAEVIIEEESGKEEPAEPSLDPPANDKPLTGPLMAQADGSPDVFLDEFTKKLEDISSGAEDSVPSVLKRPLIKEVETDVVGGIIEEPEVDPEEAVMDEEVDIPLKLKTTTNFGLPWGSLKRADNGGLVI